jgi:hypothetical protein
MFEDKKDLIVIFISSYRGILTFDAFVYTAGNCTMNNYTSG